MVLSQQLDSALKSGYMRGTLGKAWGIGLMTIAQAADSICTLGQLIGGGA